MKLSTVTICLLLIITSVFSQKLGRYTLEEWQTVIDTTWGPGLPTTTKLQLFDAAWNRFDGEYAAFQNLEINWAALRDLYRPEIETGVSRGRFAAIMNHMGFALKETHTWIDDKLINQKTPLEPGVPLFVIGSWMKNTHFGASLTPLPDSSLLVIKALPDHPFGLVPGDIVLGYDGVPWKILYKELLAAELPIHRPYMWGSTDAAMTHALLMSAGMNWHLFDTLDVVKYSGGDTVHFSTAALESQTGFIWGNEQLEIPGVAWPDIGGEDYFSTMDVINLKDFISWGIIKDTQIGYIYVVGLLGNWQIPGSDVVKQFYNAIDTLMNYYNTTGLIIDDRFNVGGDYSEKDGLSLLFNSYIEAIGIDKRCGDHFQMCPSTWWRETVEYHAIYGNLVNIYDKPIAILTGPGALSAGDYFALRMKFHPMVRVFGKPTAGAFSVFTYEDLTGNTDWQIAITNRNLYRLDNPGIYLCHTDLEVDEEVWLTREDVAKGEDTVVKRAIEWIQNLAYAHDVVVNKIYAKPATDIVTIQTEVENPNSHILSVVAKLTNSENDTVYFAPLFDDGNHNDEGTGDGVWGAFWTVPNEEETYYVSVETKDPTDNSSRTLPNVAWFTTAGPVVYESHSSYQIGNVINLLLKLKNTGSTASVKDITVELVTSDTNVIKIVNNFQQFGDIAPDQIRQSTDSYSIYLKNSTPFIELDINIYSEGRLFWNYTPMVVGIKQDMDVFPDQFALYQNYPNPFNPTTIINYQLPVTSAVELSIYNLLGQKVTTLVNERKKAGYHQVEWDASGFASGIYLYRLEVGNYVETKKMVLMR